MLGKDGVKLVCLKPEHGKLPYETDWLGYSESAIYQNQYQFYFQ